VVVEFRKTGLRRYGVFVERDRAPALAMHPAPAFDEFLPHDLLHFVAEAEWGLDGAIFGQLAAGGDAGTFWPVDKALVGAAMRRRKRLRRGRTRGRRSELLANVLERAWNARRGRTPLPEDWDERLAAARVDDRERLAEVVASLDGLAERWRRLRVGESLRLEWPRPERRARRARRQPPRGSDSRSKSRYGSRPWRPPSRPKPDSL
jgi:hypothetical protein